MKLSTTSSVTLSVLTDADTTTCLRDICTFFTSLLLLLCARFFSAFLCFVCRSLRVLRERLSCDVLCCYLVMCCSKSMTYPAPLLPSNLMFDWFLVCSFHITSSLTVYGHRIDRVLLRHLFMKVCIFCSMDVVVRHVSDPYIHSLSICVKVRSLVGI